MDIIRAEPAEFDTIVGLFHEYDFALKERTWFDWKHLRNPFGEPHIYKLIHDGALAGTVSLLAQPFRYGERKLTAVQAVDGLMGNAIRGKGLFNEVMVFTMETVPDDTTGPCFTTGFPSLPGSKKAFDNAGWIRLANIRVLKAMLTSRTLRHRPGGKLLSCLLAPFWGLVRSRYFTGATDDLEIVPVKRFAVDMDRFQPEGRICGERSADFMNWRIIDNPRDDMRAFYFRRDGEIVGYVVCKVQPGTWEIVEFRTEVPGPAAIATFLRYLSRQKLTDAVDFWLLDCFLQKDKLPDGLLERTAGGAMYVHGLDEAKLPADPDLWAGSYLDSDW